jgi:hypothetical protein
MKNIHILCMLGISLLSFVGIVNAQNIDNLSPEEQRMLLQLLLKKQAGGSQPVAPSSQPVQQGLPPPSPQPSTLQPTPVAASISTESDFNNIFAGYPKLNTGVTFERLRDGFSVNGNRYIDTEGTIVSYGFDILSGDFTYVAQTTPGNFVIKSGRALVQGDPVTIATAERRGPQWLVTTVTGKKFSGLRLIPSSRGFIVARDNTGFRYIPGKGMTSIAAPEEFAIAGLQNGDISNTGYILLERTPSANNGANNASLGQLFGAIKNLGSTLGMNKKEDYALLNIDSNKLVPVNISIEDKQVQIMSACRKRNNFVNDCAQMDSFESVFQKDGSKNLSHYFWRISWFNTPEGRPILVSQEGGLSKVSATDLNSGKKVILFERTLGIAGFYAIQKPDGEVSVSAKMGFSTENKDNVLSLIDTLPEVSGKD